MLMTIHNCAHSPAMLSTEQKVKGPNEDVRVADVSGENMAKICHSSHENQADCILSVICSQPSISMDYTRTNEDGKYANKKAASVLNMCIYFIVILS